MLRENCANQTGYKNNNITFIFSDKRDHQCKCGTTLM